MTIAELQEWLIDHYDINEIVEILQISPEEIVAAFDYKIEENYEMLVNEAEQDFGGVEDV